MSAPASPRSPPVLDRDCRCQWGECECQHHANVRRVPEMLLDELLSPHPAVASAAVDPRGSGAAEVPVISPPPPPQVPSPPPSTPPPSSPRPLVARGEHAENTLFAASEAQRLGTALGARTADVARERGGDIISRRHSAPPCAGIERSDIFGRRRRYFTMQEVSRHSSRDDCWLAAHGNVYDVTRFIPSHPAGEYAILRHAGTESTVHFDFHSSKARKMWAAYHIGYLERSDSATGNDNCVVS